MTGPSEWQRGDYRGHWPEGGSNEHADPVTRDGGDLTKASTWIKACARLTTEAEQQRRAYSRLVAAARDVVDNARMTGDPSITVVNTYWVALLRGELNTLKELGE